MTSTLLVVKLLRRISIVMLVAFYLFSVGISELSALLHSRGPLQVPILGSVDFIYKLASGEPLPEIMKNYKKKFGELIQLKTGPIRQYWVTNVEGDLASELLNTLECSGRSQLKEPAFGDEFLFLTRNVPKAREIRKRQREWVRQRGSPRRISKAVEVAFPALEAAFLTAGDKTQGVWDQDAVCQHSVRALLGTLIGGPSRQVDNEGLEETDRNISGVTITGCKEGWLTDPELRDLQKNTADYRRRGPRGRVLASKEAYAEEISGALRTALKRSVRIDKEMQSAQARLDTLPILVSAIVGGSEIYPLLLHWAIRHLAVSPGLQRALREDCRSSAAANTTPNSTITSNKSSDSGGTSEESHSLSYGSLIQKFITYVAWAHPYSVAIGPPRKLTEDVTVSVNMASPGQEEDERDVTLQREAIVFILHPGLELDWNAKFLAAHNESSSRRVLTLQEACAMRQSAEDAAEEVRQCKSTSWPMFGMGERACIAPEMSVSFLASMLCAVLSMYEVGIAAECAQQCTVRDLFAYEEDGSLLVPKRTDIRITLKPLS